MAHITYKIGFKSDKAGVESLKKGFNDLFSTIQTDIDQVSSSLKDGFVSAKSEGIRQAAILGKAIKEAATEGGVSFNKMNAALRASGTSASQMVSALSSAGMKNSLNLFLSTFSAADRKMIVLNERVKEFHRIMKQSVQYTMAQGIQRFVMGQIQGAISWVQQLNAEIVKIGNFAEMSGTQMADTFDHVIKRARDLNVTALDYAQAAFIFYQQGLPQEEIDRRADTVIRAARASLQDITETGKQMTAIWNTYRMSGDEIERAASVAAALSSTTAAEFADIAQGMQIAASGAAMLGVAYDSLASIMATVVSVTQQSASVVGNAYKTIFARLTNLRAGGMEDGVDLGQITTQLQQLGVNVLDAQGNLRALDDVIMELGLTWDSYSQKQQIAIAQVVGGIRQYQQFLALMSNFDMYLDNLATANAEVFDGALTRQYLISLQSIDHAKRMMTEEWRQALSSLFPVDAQRTFFKGMTELGRQVGSILDLFGGINGVLLAAGTILATKFLPKLTEVPRMIQEAIAGRNMEGQMELISKDFDNIGKDIQKSFDANVQDLQIAANLKIQDSPENRKQIQEQFSRDFDQLEIGFKYDQQRLSISEDQAKKQAQLNDLIANGTKAQKAHAETLKTQLQKQHELELSILDEAEAAELRNNKLLKSLEASEKKQTIMVKQSDEMIAQVERAGELAELDNQRAERAEQEAQIKAEMFEKEGQIQQKRVEAKEAASATAQEDLANAKARLEAMEAAGNSSERQLASQKALVEQSERLAREKANAAAQTRIAASNSAEQARQARVAADVAERLTQNTRDANRAAIEKRDTVRATGGFLAENNQMLGAAAALVKAQNDLFNKGTKSVEDIQLGLEGVHDAIAASIKQFEASDGFIPDDMKDRLEDFKTGLEDLNEFTPEDLQDHFLTLHETIVDLADITETTVPNMKNLKETFDEVEDAANRMNTEKENTALLMQKIEGHAGTAEKSMAHLVKSTTMLVGASIAAGKGVANLVASLIEGDITVGQVITSIVAFSGYLIMLQSQTQIFTKIKAKLTAAKAADAAMTRLQTVANAENALMNVKQTGTILAKAAAYVKLAIAKFLALKPIALLIAAVGALKIKLALLAIAIVAVVAAFMILRRNQERAAENTRKEAAAMAAAAEASKELANELNNQANAVRRVIRAWDEMDINEQITQFNALKDELHELNRLHPELNLDTNIRFDENGEGMRRILEQLEQGRQQMINTAAEQAAAAHQTQLGGINRGTGTRGQGDTVTRNLRKGGPMRTADSNQVQEAAARLGLDLGGDGGHHVDLELLAQHFDQLYNDMIMSGGPAGQEAARRFKEEFMENTPGFADLIEIGDADRAAQQAAEAVNRAMEMTRDENGQGLDEEAMMGNAMEIAQDLAAAEEEVAAAIQRRGEAQRNIADLEAQLENSQNRNARNQIEAQLAIERAALSRATSEVTAAQEGEAALRAAVREARNLCDTYADIDAVLLLLQSRDDWDTFDEDAQLEMMVEGLELFQNGMGGVISMTDRASAEIEIMNGRLNAAREAMEEFNREGSAGEQVAQLEAINEALREAGMQELGNDFLTMSAAQQAREMARINDEIAENEFENYAKRAEAAAEYADMRRQMEIDLTNDMQAEVDQRQQELNDAQQAYEDHMAAIARAEAAVRQARQDNNSLIGVDWSGDIARAEADLARLHRGTGELASGVSNAQEALGNYVGQLNDLHTNAASSAEEAARREAEAEAARLIRIGRLHDAHEDLRNVIEGISLSDFTGSVAAQGQAFNDANDAFQDFNTNMARLEDALGTGFAGRISALPPYFLALSEAQQQAMLSGRQLQMATIELNAAMRQFGPNSTQAAVAVSNLGRAMAAAARVDFNQIDRHARHMERMALVARRAGEEINFCRRAALEMATSIAVLDRGVAEVCNSWEAWSDVLQNANSDSMEMINTLYEMANAVADMTGLDIDFIGIEHMEDPIIQAKLATIGTTESMEELQATVLSLHEAMAGIVAEEAMTQWVERASASVDEFRESIIGIEDVGGHLHRQLNSMRDGVKNFESALQDVIALEPGKQMAADMNSAFGSMVNDMQMTQQEFHKFMDAMNASMEMGVDYTLVGIDVPMMATRTYSREITDHSHGPGVTAVESWQQQIPDAGMGRKYVVAIGEGAEITRRTTKGAISRPQRMRSDSGGDTPSPTSLESMSRPELRERQIFEDRFRDTNVLIDENSRALSRLEAQMANLHGPARLAAMERHNQLLAQDSALRADIYQQAARYIALEQANLQQNLVEFNVTSDALQDLKRYLDEVHDFAVDYIEDLELDFRFEFTDAGEIRNMQRFLTQVQAIHDAELARYNDLVEIGRQLHAERELKSQQLEDLENEQKLAHEEEVLRLNQEIFYNEQLRAIRAQRISDISNADSNVRDTANALTQAVSEQQAAYDAITDNVRRALMNAIEGITYQMEIDIEVDTRQIERLQWMINRLGSSQARQASTMIRSAMNHQQAIGNTIFNAAQELGGLLLALDDTEESFEDLAVTMARSLGMTVEHASKLIESGEAVSIITRAIEGKKEALKDNFRSAVALVDQMVNVFVASLNRYIQSMDSLLSRLGAAQAAAQAAFSIWEMSAGHYRDAAGSIDLLIRQYQGLEMASQAALNAQAGWSNMQSAIREVIGHLERGEAATATARAIELGVAVPFGATIQDLEAQLVELQTKIVNSQLEQASNFQQRVQILLQRMGIEADRIIREMAMSLTGQFSDISQALQQFNNHVDRDTFFLSPRSLDFELRQLKRHMERELDGIDLELYDPELNARYGTWLNRIHDKQRRMNAENLKAGEELLVMTQKEFDILKAEFDLDVARAQLAEEEENRQKTTMRLARDASGNWSYVFSDDEDAGELDDMEWRVEELKHNIYQMHRDAALSHERMWMQIQADMSQFIQNINWDLYRYNEEYRAHVDATLAHFRAMGAKHTRQIHLHNEAISRCFTETSLGYITQADSIMDANRDWMDNQTQTVNYLRDNHNRHMNYVAKYVAEIEGIMSLVEDVNQDVVNSTQALAQEAGAELHALAAAVGDAVSAMIDHFNQLMQQIEELIALLAELAAMQDQVGVGPGPRGGNVNQGGWGAQNAASQRNLLNFQTGTDLGRQGGETWHGGGENIRQARTQILGSHWEQEAGYMNHRLGRTDITPDMAQRFWDSSEMRGIRMNIAGTGFERHVDGLGHMQSIGEAYILSHLKNFADNAPGRAAGGSVDYTGLTMLHGSRRNPEFVLNPNDTRNMLTAVQIMRDGIQQNLRNLGSARTQQFESRQADRLEQQVSIQADFPNVTDSNQIQDAMLGLVNRAAQYAPRRRH